MRPARITGGSQDESEHPRLTEFVTLASAEAERSVFDSAWEAIQNHRIALAVDDVFNFTDQTSLNEGRDVNPGDTYGEDSDVVRYKVAQRRPGRESRRHSRQSGRPRAGTRSLNEGRDVNPGDTSGQGLFFDPDLARSTKAGT